MDDAKRRAAIRLQVAKNKETDVDAMGTVSSKPSAKRRPLPKGDRAPKKQEVSSEPVLGLMAESAKTVTPAKHGGRQGPNDPSTRQLKETARYTLRRS